MRMCEETTENVKRTALNNAVRNTLNLKLEHRVLNESLNSNKIRKEFFPALTSSKSSFFMKI